MSARHFAAILIIFVGTIESCSGLNCNDGTLATISHCRAIVDSEVMESPLNQGCVVPNVQNAHMVLESNCQIVLVSGETAPHLSFITYECEPGYLRLGSRFNLCYSGDWHLSTHPTCIVPKNHCPNVFESYYGIQVACHRNGLTVSCDEPIVPGTVARIKCLNRYERVNESGSDTLFCQEDGSWNNEIMSCRAVCGELVTRATPFIENAELSKVTFVPWHVAIYKKESGSYNYHCGGTIISEYEVVTAAVCLFKPGTEDIEDKSLFLVAAGKHLGYHNANDPKAQFVAINDLLIKESSDAIVQLEDCLIFTPLIGPVCLGELNDEKGNLVNYGREEENGRITRDTRLIPLAHEERFIDCASIEVNEICATDQCAETLCRNFLGSGFTVEVVQDGISRHHLVGTASVAEHNKIKLV